MKKTVLFIPGFKENIQSMMRVRRYSRAFHLAPSWPWQLPLIAHPLSFCYAHYRLSLIMIASYCGQIMTPFVMLVGVGCEHFHGLTIKILQSVFTVQRQSFTDKKKLNH